MYCIEKAFLRFSVSLWFWRQFLFSKPFHIQNDEIQKNFFVKDFSIHTNIVRVVNWRWQRISLLHRRQLHIAEQTPKCQKSFPHTRFFCTLPIFECPVGIQISTMFQWLCGTSVCMYMGVLFFMCQNYNTLLNASVVPSLPSSRV